MKRKYKILLTIGLVLLLVAGTCAGYLYRLHPVMSGTQSIKGLKAPVEVLFDSYGIPHIYAQSETDAYYTLGYLHAQERLFQMEIVRRLVTGRLSALLGEELVETDKLFRTLSLKQYGEKSAATFLGSNFEPYQQAANAYLAGVNQFIETGKTPVEYTMLGIPKEKFTVSDFYGTVGYMAFGFAQAFRTDPLLTKINEKLGSNYLRELATYGTATPFPESARIPSDTSHSASYSDMTRLSHRVSSIFASVMPVAPLHGSNAWVISGKRTQSGRVLFSNDTHIGYSQPAVWYEAHIECPGFSFYGNYLAGLPFAPVGHNRTAGWGLTMFENDDIDFYREKINPANPNQVWATDHWEDLQVRKEVIKVKDGTDVTINVRTSRHGVIINDVLKAVGETNAQPVSLWWTLQQAPTTILQGAYQLAHARNLQEAQKAASLMDSPGLNIMYGDAEGNIAWWAAAKLVKRPPHVNSVLLLDGASGKDEPLGFYDFSQNPHSINPASGYIYSANNQPGKVAGGYYPGYYLAEDRARRITTFLDDRDKTWDINALKEMVLDTRSYSAPLMLNSMLAPLQDTSGSKNYQNALSLLKEWDGRHGLDDVAPTIYYKLLYNVTEGLFLDELGKEDFETLHHTYTLHSGLPRLVANDTSAWWDNIQTRGVTETREQVFKAAFDRTLKELENQLGADVSGWKWKRVHTLEHIHPVGRKKPFDKFFNVGAFAVPGGQEVINNLSFELTADGYYRVSNGPAMRTLLDWADVENSVSVLPTGQSGYFMSKHYDDQAELFNTGGFRKQMMNREEIVKTAGGKLVLTPE